MLTLGNDAWIRIIFVGIKNGLFPVRVGNLFPQLLGAVLTTVPDMKRDDLARLSVESQPDPPFVRLVAHEIPYLLHDSKT